LRKIVSTFDTKRLLLLAILSVISCGSISAEQHAITIPDIVELRKVGQIAISPNNDSVAYLVVHAIIEKDAYSVSLIVTSASDPQRHDLVMQVETPAVRTQDSGVYEDIGSRVTGGIVFAWKRGASELIYGVPTKDGTDLFQYSFPTRTTKHLWKTKGEVTTLADLAIQGVGYCVIRPPAVKSRDQGADPAYRYDRATFHSWDKQPWLDGRVAKGGVRTFFDPSPEQDCFAQNDAKGIAQSVPRNSVIVSTTPVPRYTKAVGVMGTANFNGKNFEGNPVVVAIDSPDRNNTLFGAKVAVPESSNSESKMVYFVESTQNGATKQRVLFTKGGETDNHGEIDRFFWTRDSLSIIYFRSSFDGTEINKIDVNSGKTTQLLRTDWGFEGPTNLSSNGRYLYETREKPNVPKELCRIDLNTGRMVLIDDINRQFEDVRVPPYSPIRQTNKYGDELTGYLFVPPGFHGQERLPFVAIKGPIPNAFCDGGTGVEYPGMVMAMKGFAVLFFSPGKKEFISDKGDAQYSLLRFESPIESLRLVISELGTKGWIDPGKTGIAGLSFGADIVDYASGFSSVFSVGEAAGGDALAPANYFLWNKDVLEAFTKRWGLPAPDTEGLHAWQKVSASLNASHSRMPLLFQPPDSEAWSTVPQHLAWQNAGIPVATYVYPDEGHMKIHPLNRYYVMLRNLQWFDFWLRQAEDLRPQFSDQFERWEEMRAVWNKHLTSTGFQSEKPSAQSRYSSSDR
jgi:dipeptidyl aminopeptidase/acylaminoacyl peptidase